MSCYCLTIWRLFVHFRLNVAWILYKLLITNKRKFKSQPSKSIFLIMRTFEFHWVWVEPQVRWNVLTPIVILSFLFTLWSLLYIVCEWDHVCSVIALKQKSSSKQSEMPMAHWNDNSGVFCLHLIKILHRLLYKEDQCDSFERDEAEFSPNMCRALLTYSRLHG